MKRHSFVPGYGITAVILAGGENKRIPFIKGLIEVNGKRIIESAFEVLSNIFDRVCISTNTPERYFYIGAPLIGDVFDTRGPITGIFSALMNSERAIFVTGCDMPFIEKKLIEHLLAKSAKIRRFDAIIPVFNQQPQPLFGIYSKSCLGKIERRIKGDIKGMRRLLEALKTCYIEEEVVMETDPEGRSFVNINTINDLERIRGGKICSV